MKGHGNKEGRCAFKGQIETQHGREGPADLKNSEQQEKPKFDIITA